MALNPFALSAAEQSVALFYCLNPVAKLRPHPNAAILVANLGELEKVRLKKGGRRVCLSKCANQKQESNRTMTLHSFEIEIISDMDWEGIRQCSDILRSTTARPSKRAVNAANGNFLVEIGNSDDRGELVRRCVLVTSKRATLITLADAPGGKYRTSWKAWEGIQESEIDSLNSELLSAVASLYGFTESRLVQGVTNNPHNPPSEIPKDTLLKAFDTQVSLWFETKRLRLSIRNLEELKKGKESLFMWRFYWTKWKGVPTYTAIDSNLIGLLSAYLRHPNHSKTLLEHLDGGGDGFSEDTKRVLVHLRSINGV